MPQKGKGVEFNPPPPDILPGVMKSIDKAIASLPKDAKGALIGVVDQSGVNAVVVGKVGGGFEVQAWIGKKWTGSVEGGAAVRKVW